MGFSFPKIKLPPIRLPPVKLPPPPIKINIPPVKVPPPLKKIVLPPPIKINIPPPKVDMKKLQTATGIIAGIISLNPIGKALVTASVGIADAATKGKATNYLDNGHKTNSTLGMIPGGRLIQSVANEASGGKSGNFLNKIPDPKKSLFQDIGSIGKTIVTNPSNTGNTIKSVAQSHKPNLQSIINKVVSKPTTLLKPVVDVVKPSLLDVFKVKEDLRRQIPVMKTLIPVSAIAIVPYVSTLGNDPSQKNNPVKRTIAPIGSTLGIPPIKPTAPPVVENNSYISSLFSTPEPPPPVKFQNNPMINSTLGVNTIKPTPTTYTPTLPTLPTYAPPPVIPSTPSSTLGLPMYKPQKTTNNEIVSESQIPIIPIALLCLGVIILMRK